MQGSHDPPVIDAGIIADLRGTGAGGALLERVLGLFETKAPQAIANIARLAATPDRTELADAVHALKSMCANIGALRAAAACDAVERQARGDGQFDAVQGAAMIAGEVAEALREVRSLRAA